MKSKSFCDYCDKKGCSKGGNPYAECFDGNRFNGVEVEPVTHARWVEHIDEFGDVYYQCSNCKEEPLTKWGTMHDYVLTDYCPHCVARMDGGLNEEL